MDHAIGRKVGCFNAIPSPYSTYENAEGRMIRSVLKELRVETASSSVVIR